MLWSRADCGFPSENISPLDHGWTFSGTNLMPVGFEGDQFPKQTDSLEKISEDFDDSSEEEWSEDSEDSSEDD